MKYINLLIAYFKFVLININFLTIFRFSSIFNISKDKENLIPLYYKTSIINNNVLFFKFIPLKYFYNLKYKIVEIEFNIEFFDKNRQFIIPSDLVLYYDIHIICHLKKKYNFNEDSLANIYKNKYFNCKEYFDINEKIKVGIKVYINKEHFLIFYMTNYKNINNTFYKINNKSYNIDFDYFSLSSNTKDDKISNNSLLLKKLFILEPIYLKKDKSIKNKNIWYFRNIYNNYFCFCYGQNCLYRSIPQDCKYKLYLSIIYNNRFLYNKTDYLLGDFLFEYIAPGDAYILFKEMINRNLPAHYVTERKDIYKEYTNDKKELLRIIPIYNKEYNITGDTLEKYLNLFLKLKVVISGAEFYSIFNIFYSIEYITFICLGHGVNYFKPFLYRDYYGYTKYKIILPSNKIIKIAKKYGWKEDNIIKVGLPKWDLFDNYNMKVKMLSEQNKVLITKSIFIMFTWRGLNKGKEISTYYFNNIILMLNHYELNKALEESKINIYISIHHNLLDKQNLIKLNKNIKYIKQENIIECLANSSLIISDFSSIIFDLIYQKKPFIIYIPDSEDPNIKDLYTQEYLEVINSLKNGSIFFENKFFNIEDVIKKILFYINNNFKLEKKLLHFYQDFEFKGKNHINNLINYLKIL